MKKGKIVFNPEAVKSQGKKAFVKAWKDRVTDAEKLYDDIVASIK